MKESRTWIDPETPRPTPESFQQAHPMLTVMVPAAAAAELRARGSAAGQHGFTWLQQILLLTALESIKRGWLINFWDQSSDEGPRTD